jgi:hypothetical protein
MIKHENTHAAKNPGFLPVFYWVNVFIFGIYLPTHSRFALFLSLSLPLSPLYFHSSPLSIFIFSLFSLPFLSFCLFPLSSLSLHPPAGRTRPRALRIAPQAQDDAHPRHGAREPGVRGGRCKFISANAATEQGRWCGRSQGGGDRYEWRDSDKNTRKGQKEKMDRVERMAFF